MLAPPLSFVFLCMSLQTISCCQFDKNPFLECFHPYNHFSKAAVSVIVLTGLQNGFLSQSRGGLRKSPFLPGGATITFPLKNITFPFLPANYHFDKFLRAFLHKRVIWTCSSSSSSSSSRPVVKCKSRRLLESAIEASLPSTKRLI